MEQKSNRTLKTNCYADFQYGTLGVANIPRKVKVHSKFWELNFVSFKVQGFKAFYNLFLNLNSIFYLKIT